MTGSIPLIVDNNKKVFGRVDCFVNYLTGTVNQIKHLMPPEYSQELTTLMNWYLSVFKPASQRLIKLHIGDKLGIEMPSSDEVKEIKADFFETVLPQLESMLAETDYLCQNETHSALDILYYNEFGCFIALYPRDSLI